MTQFDGYVQALVENPDQAVVYEDIGEAPQQFVLSLRGAFRRAKLPVVVRKLRGRDEVRAWVAEPGEAEEAAAPPEAESIRTEPEANGQAPRRKRARAAS